jgi:hypothetical protein
MDCVETCHVIPKAVDYEIVSFSSCSCAFH